MPDNALVLPFAQCDYNKITDLHFEGIGSTMDERGCESSYNFVFVC